MVGRVIYRKRQVDEVYKKISPMLQKRNQQIAYQLSNYNFQFDHQLSQVEKLLGQSEEEELDMVEIVAVENKINQYFDEALLNNLAKHENAHALYDLIINSNFLLKEARAAFNSAVTYHNYSVEFFPTKNVCKLLAYQTVPQLAYPNNAVAELHLPKAAVKPID